MMSLSLLEQLELDIEKLSLPDQLWLIERLVHGIRERTRTISAIQERPSIYSPHSADSQQFPELVIASNSSLSFWDNPLDDEDWNES